MTTRSLQSLRHLLLHALVLVSVSFGVLVGFSATDAQASEGHVEQAAGEQDPCESECPGDTPDGDCEDTCQHCSCCSFTATSLPPSLGLFTPLPIPASTRILAPTSAPRMGIAIGVFKPPRHLRT